jgi:selenocysteine-specific elongation factor
LLLAATYNTKEREVIAANMMTLLVNPRPAANSILRALALLAIFAVSVTMAFQTPVRPVGVHSPAVVSMVRPSRSSTAHTTTTALNVFGKKKKNDEDLSFIETRDMTRAEMEELNRKNEDIMNAEIAGMTLFSLILSLPLLYLAWVGFFSETAEIAGDLSPYAQ